MRISLLPQPKQFTVATGFFHCPDHATVGIGDHSLLEPARRLAALFPAAEIAVAAPGLADTVTILRDASLRCDEYAIRIAPRAITIIGQSPRAVFYALQTFAQIAEQSPEDRLPCLTIHDWPDFEDRGVYYDVCRGRVPKLAQLKALAQTLAQYKINQLQLYIEHTFAFRSHPDIGKDASPLTAADVLELDAHCRALQIELVPSLASFGHMATVLKHPQYHALAEDWGIGRLVDPASQDVASWGRRPAWSLAPANPDIYPFLDSLFGEFLPLFSSKRFNVCCDETLDLGMGQSYELCEKRGKGVVYLDHIRKLSELSAKYDKRLMFWGDIIRHHPELIPQIPKNVTVLDWGYGINHPFDRIKEFKAAGLSFYACPGTSSWQSLFPRLPVANANIAGFAAAGKRHGAQGLLNTDWGDGGHYNFMEYSFHGYLFGAEQAWNNSADTIDCAARRLAAFGAGSRAPAAERAAVRRQLVELRGRFRQLWLARNRPSEIRITLERYDAAIRGDRVDLDIAPAGKEGVFRFTARNAGSTAVSGHVALRLLPATGAALPGGARLRIDRLPPGVTLTHDFAVTLCAGHDRVLLEAIPDGIRGAATASLRIARTPA